MRSLSLSREYKEPHDPKQYVFEDGELAHNDRKMPDMRQQSPGAAQDLVLADPRLPRVERPVEAVVVVALGEDVLVAVFALVHLEDAVHDRDLAAGNLEHDCLADREGLGAQVEEEDVALVERGLHAAREDDDDGGLGAGVDHEGLPDH